MLEELAPVLGELLNHRFHKIFYDCYIASTVPITTELRAEAALGISPPGSYPSHFTAALPAECG
jgi:hypothetical protein